MSNTFTFDEEDTLIFAKFLAARVRLLSRFSSMIKVLDGVPSSLSNFTHAPVLCDLSDQSSIREIPPSVA
jgi:hypothetical protein